MIFIYNGCKLKFIGYKVPIWGDIYISDIGELLQCAGPSGSEALRLIVEYIK